MFEDGLVVPLTELFGLQNDNGLDQYASQKVQNFTFDFVLKQVFEDALGKYSQIFGNVAFVDCHYMLSIFLDSVIE